MIDLPISPQAESDLAEIFEYTFENWGMGQAERYQDELFAGMQIIIENPEIGKNYNFGEKKYRKLHVNRHLLFYRIENQNCIIVRILHDQMDVDTHTKD